MTHHITDEQIEAVTLEQWGQDAIRAAHRQFARAVLALLPQSESDARRAAQEQLYTERERHTAEVKRLQAEIGRLQAETAEPFGYFRSHLWGWTDCRPDDEGAVALYERPQVAPMTGQQSRPLSREELADCCGGCASNSAIETWMRRAIAKFCEVNGITAPAGGEVA